MTTLAVSMQALFADEVIVLSPYFGTNIRVLDETYEFKVNIGSPITYMNKNNIDRRLLARLLATADVVDIAQSDTRFDVERYDGRVVHMSSVVDDVGLKFHSGIKSPICLTTDPLPRFGYVNELGLGPIVHPPLAPPGSRQSRDLILFHNTLGLPVIRFPDDLYGNLRDMMPSCSGRFASLPVDSWGARLRKFSITGTIQLGDTDHPTSLVLATIHNFVELPRSMLRDLLSRLRKRHLNPIQHAGNPNIYLVENCSSKTLTDARLPTIDFSFGDVIVRLGPESYLDARSQIAPRGTCTVLVRQQSLRGHITIGQPFLRRSIIGIERGTSPNTVSVCGV
jgi:hypothetical protein